MSMIMTVSTYEFYPIFLFLLTYQIVWPRQKFCLLDQFLFIENCLLLLQCPFLYLLTVDSDISRYKWNFIISRNLN